MRKMLINLLFSFVLLTPLLADANVEKGNRIITLPKVWKFKIDPDNVGENKQWFQASFSVAGWDSIDVPSNWDVKNVYANYKGKAWYRTEFLTPEFSNKKLFLAMGEVGMSYTIYINGKSVATLLSGNCEEEFDIEKFVKKGKRNTLCILVDNSFIWGAYYSWGGLRRAAKLIVREPVFLERQEIIASPNLITGTASISTTVFINNSTKTSQLVDVKQIIKKDNQEYITAIIHKLIPAKATIKHTFNQQLSKEQVQLWHFDHPHLYNSAITISVANQSSFVLNNKFGIRKIELDGYKFMLNGESVRLAGYNWVADDRTTGSTLPEFRFKEDIDLMKAAGANMARLSHRPLPENVMDYLDEKGMLVMAEFNTWPQFMNASSKESELFATKLIQQNFNHPCIFGWSVGNENGNLKENPQVNAYTASIIKYIKANLDSSRLVTYVSNTADFQDNDAAQFCDVIMINKYGSYEKGIDELKKRYPNKAVFMSEYGGHTENLIYDTPDKTTFKSLMVDNLTAKENLFGYSIWTFNDYRSNYQSPNPLTTTPVHQNRQWGIVDVYRNKKRAYEQMQHFYAPVKKLVVNAKTNSNGKIQTKIVLQPRYKNDIPAYELKGYKLVWQVRNSDNLVVDASAILLPNIKPGDDSLVFNIDSEINNVSYVKVALLSPTDYVVLDATSYLKAPPPPIVEAFITASKEARIIFSKNDFTKEFVVKYKAEDGTVKSLKPTIDHYADVTGLSLNKMYEIWVTGINDFGESKVSTIHPFTPTAGHQNLPPIIWQSEPADKGFFVGYSYHYTDIEYNVRYGTSLANKVQWKTISTNIFGMLQVPNLKNNQTYFYQIARKPAFTNTISEWSELKEIVPNKFHQFGKPIVHGFKQLNKKLVVFLGPSKNATGYQIICNTDKGKEVFIMNRSLVEIVSFELSNNAVVKNIEIALK